MKATRSHERGSALLVAMAMGIVLLLLVAALFSYVAAERIRASRPTRELTRADCAQAGLEIARSFFAKNVSNWNTYLSTPKYYNPVPATWNTTPADPVAGATTWGTGAPYSSLFYDLDGDGKADVYIYIRDNQDEILPASNNWQQDNDQNVIVGSVCISSTLGLRLPNGRLDPSQLTAESLLSYNTPSNTYTGQSGGGASSSGNIN